MRTQEEILIRARERQKDDVLGFEWQEYVRALDYDHAKEFLKDGAEWEPDLNTDIAILEKAKEYMSFAWEKANNCRGISAARSLMHYKAWLWMLGEDGFDDLDDYEYYGKPQLERICAYLGLDPKQWDDDIRTNTEVI